ncbi:MAG: hypothetical protein QNL01_07655 [Akkermansiaceae bacterium]|tara:strand:+ start:3389 stop:3763 length:375 start_codon:yes stop_codon:yes gene_type:complete
MADIPGHKRSDNELSELRKRNAFAVRPPVQQLKNQALHPIILALGYILCLTGAGLAIGEIYISGLACASIALLFILFIFWKKPRSRHHAAIMAIISLLVLVFGTVYYLEQFEQTTYDAQGPIRY